MSRSRACTSHAPRRMCSKRTGSNDSSSGGRPATALKPMFGSTWSSQSHACPPPSVSTTRGATSAKRAAEATIEDVGRLDDVIVGRHDRGPRRARLRLGEERDCRGRVGCEVGALDEVFDRHAHGRQSRTSGSVTSSWRTAPSQNVGGQPSLSPGFIDARMAGAIGRGSDAHRHRVVREPAHPLERDRVVAGLTDGAPGDEAAVVGEQHRRRSAHLFGEEHTGVGVADEAVVLVDERDVTVEDARVLVHERWSDAEARKECHVVGVTVHDHGCVGTRAVQLGVDEHRPGRAPLPVDHLAVGAHQHDVGGLRLLPPDSPGVAPEVVGALLRPRDVARHVLLPARTGKDPQRARQLLLHRQRAADAEQLLGCGPRRRGRVLLRVDVVHAPTLRPSLSSRT